MMISTVTSKANHQRECSETTMYTAVPLPNMRNAGSYNILISVGKEIIHNLSSRASSLAYASAEPVN
ncbi:hypothetical protein EV696_1225 [Permianibacter aggregans]|uniref:Uncharacterized protein n=1 Tax=Permianibacter aggregans TaxID=1510150 RepID=A0A4R6UHX7_9GAMM|nr:hypothetical protein EV696_1225 [Permianibacter aggregans]